jgi:carbamoyl-phosphate synthase/aspartate carbamoyltransferase/dihydroorotase
MPTLKLPALIDAHVHLREPGETHKEDFTTGTAAALAGGVTAVLDMPNTKPPIIDTESLASKRELVRRKALCDVGFFIGAAETNTEAAVALADGVAGLKLYLNQTHGPLRVHDLATLLRHFTMWSVDRPIAVHAEGLSVAIAIGLSASFGRRLHVCHVSLAREIALIRAAKERGLAITCEVTPHHLFLTDGDAERLGPYGRVRPPLARETDRAALWSNLDCVDCIATDHAPHTRAEKDGDNPPPGLPGLETMLPLLLTAVAEGRLTVERLIEMTHRAPGRIFGLLEQPETWIEVDPGCRRVLGGAGLYTKCGWTPFEGVSVSGKLRRVILRGATVFEDGEVRAAPGYGCALEPAARFLR